MKKIIISCLFILFLSVANISLARTGTVNGRTVRIRESADASSNIVTNAYRNETVNILEEQGDWYKVEYEGTTGYMSKEFVNVEEIEQNNSEQPSENQSTVSDNTQTPQENPNTNQPEAPVEATDETENVQTQENTTEENTNQDNVQSNSSESENISNTTIIKDTNIKLLPNFSSRNISKIENGAQIEVLLEVNNWIKVKTSNNESGWILKSNASGFEIDSNITENNNTEASNTEQPVENTTIEASASESDTTESAPDANSNPEEQPVENTGNYDQKTGYINTDTVRIRETAGGKIIGNLDIYDEVTIIGEEGEWYQVSCNGFESGYVSKSLITMGKVPSRNLTEVRQSELDKAVEEAVEATEPKVEEVNPENTIQATPPQPEVVETPAPSTNTDLGVQIAEFAKSFLGSRYVSGGTTPNGFDCSGFTQYVYAQFGYSINRVAADQSANGVEVSRENMQPGDIILFQDSGRTMIGHVAIYIGDGNFVHAANPRRGVVIDNINTNSYYNIRFVSARRII